MIESQNTESALDLLEFPNRYPLKVFGKPSPDFEQSMVDLVRLRCPKSEQIDVSRKESKGGKYIALTLTFTAWSRQQIEEIYADLHQSDLVVMTL